MLIAWFYAALDSVKSQLENSLSKIKCSLLVVAPRVPHHLDLPAPMASEPDAPFFDGGNLI